MIVEVLYGITGVFSVIVGLFLIGLPLFGWKEIKTFLISDEIPSMHVMLAAVGIIGCILFVSGTSTVFNLIG